MSLESRLKNTAAAVLFVVGTVSSIAFPLVYGHQTKEYQEQLSQFTTQLTTKLTSTTKEISYHLYQKIEELKDYRDSRESLLAFGIALTSLSLAAAMMLSYRKREK